MESKFIYVVIGIFLISALYALMNVSPNKVERKLPLLNSGFFCMLVLVLCLSAGAGIIGLFKISLYKGIIASAACLSGYFLSWYLIRIPKEK